MPNSSPKAVNIPPLKDVTTLADIRAKKRHLRIQLKLSTYLKSLHPAVRYDKHHPSDLAFVCGEKRQDVVRTMRALGWSPTGRLLTAGWYPPTFPRESNNHLKSK